MISKSIKLSQEAKYFLNMLSEMQSKKLSDDIVLLKQKAEEYFQTSEIFREYSCVVNFNVSTGSIITNSYNYCIQNYTIEDLKNKIIEMKTYKIPNESQDVGNCYLKITIPDEIEQGIYSLCLTLKHKDMSRGYNYSYIISLLLYVRYTDSLKQIK